jgi:phenylacetate-CoA ligase
LPHSCCAFDGPGNEGSGTHKISFRFGNVRFDFFLQPTNRPDFSDQSTGICENILANFSSLAMAIGNSLTRSFYQNSPAILQNLMASVYSRQMGKKKFGLRFEENLADLRRKQWYSQQDILQIQLEKLRRVLNFAHEFVPYYQNLFNELGIQVGGIRTIEDLRKIPLLDKTTFQHRCESFKSRLYQGSDRIHTVHTSGSTGTALSIDVDVDYLKLEKAYLWLQREWCGVKLGDRSAQFSGMPVVPIKRRKPPFWVHDRSENRTIFSVRHMSPENLHAYAERLVTLDPQMIVGYPMAIYLVAACLNEYGMKSVRPRGVFTASETLHSYQREVIERAFGCRVLDLYGQMEYTGMLMQCELGNYHIQEDYGVVEILNQDGNPAGIGEIGEMVATGLNNLAMPLVRYRTNDMAVPKDGSCSCGRCGKLVERVVGRIDDVIVTPDGRMLNRVSSVFMEMPGIVEAQLVQESIDLLLVRVVPRISFSEADQALLTRKLKEHTGNSMHFKFQIFDRIPRRASGKFQFVISKIPLGFAKIRQPGSDTV